MPETGYGPFGGIEPGMPTDMSGGGIDPSYAWALASGGRFPGDEYFWAEYQAALDRGTAGGNAAYDVPDWLQGLGRFGRLLGAHERNVRTGGIGNEPALPGGYPWQGWSGPGAPYGPGGITPTRGLFDQGRPVDAIWDTPEMRPPVDGGGGRPGKPRGGGGGGGKFEFTPYGGLQHRAQFVDWQPIAPGTRSNEPTRFVPGAGSSTPATAQPVAGKPGKPGKPGKLPPGDRAPGRGVRQPQGGAGGGAGAGQGQGRPPTAGAGGVMPSTGETLVPRRGPFGGVGQTARDSIFGGVDPNFLDFRTPGWRRDPTTGIVNTSGMPLPTPPARGAMESESEYAGRLHDLGFSGDDIMSLTGPSSGWGAGGVEVVRDSNGNPLFYGFSNAARNIAVPQSGGTTPGDAWRPGLWWQGDYPGMSRDASERGAGAGPSLFEGHGGQTGMTRNQEGSFNDFLTAANNGFLLR